MSSTASMLSKLEDLPDEVLLAICRYLSSINVLSAFYGLNTRLSQTIHGYTHYVSLDQVPYQQFTYLCSSILPNIGQHIHSLTLTNKYQTLLSKVFLEYFHTSMSTVFPRLKYLTLIGFTSASLLLFSKCLDNLFELTTVDIRGLTESDHSIEEYHTILHQIFSMNDNRLKSISFDDDSMSFITRSIKMNMPYPNIEKLNVKLKTLDAFHNILSLLPQLQSLDVTIDALVIGSADKYESYPVCELKELSFRGLKCSWDWEYIRTVFNRIPKVEKLTLIIVTMFDSRLLVGEELFSRLSLLPLKEFNYILAYYNFSIDIPTILSTWKQFRSESVFVESDDITGLMFYTLPPNFRQLIVPYHLSTSVANAEFIRCCWYKVKQIYLENLPSRINQTFLLLTKCYRIKRLILLINTDTQPTSDDQYNILRKLPFLTSLELPEDEAIDAEDSQMLLEASPNLFHLIINHQVLGRLFDNEDVCQLFGQRITHLKISLDSNWSESNEVQVTRLLSTFPHLKYLCFDAQSFYDDFEPLIRHVLNHLTKWTSLISFSILNVTLTEETVSKGIVEWICEHIGENHRNSFVVNRLESGFHLWL